MPTRSTTAMLDKAIFGREPTRTLDEMSVEDLEARRRVMSERKHLARVVGRAAGVCISVVGGSKLAWLRTFL
jgi:hypothetical protein